MRPLRVLTADDNDLALLVLRKALTQLGHTIVGEASDGEQAVQFAGDTNPDLAILDVCMPVMDGFEASRRIHGRCPIPTIILSCHTESGFGEQAATAGANAYLVKPFTMEQLNPVIELALADFEKFQTLERQLQLMTEALEGRKVIERAKGILMRHTGLDEEHAYLMLRKTARKMNRKLVDVARTFIEAEKGHAEGFRIGVLPFETAKVAADARAQSC